MPRTASGKLFFTDAQYKYARYETSALEYAIQQGYNLIPEGCNKKYFHLAEHDSMIFKKSGEWFWNSRGLKGGALEFIIYYEGKSTVEAVLILNGEALEYPAVIPRQGVFRNDSDVYYKKQNKDTAPKPFELPEKSASFRRLFAYLCSTRKLDRNIVKELVDQGRLYESVYRYPDLATGQSKEKHNAVFVGFDSKGVPRSAFQRGVNTYAGSPFKRDAPGSQKQYAFCVPGHPNITMVYAFEASIDAISHATLTKRHCGDYKTADRIALGGVAAAPLLHYLQDHTKVKHIVLSLDNDAAGVIATDNIQTVLLSAGYTPECGYNITTDVPTYAKDWNDVLRAVTESKEYSSSA